MNQKISRVTRPVRIKKLPIYIIMLMILAVITIIVFQFINFVNERSVKDEKFWADLSAAMLASTPQHVNTEIVDDSSNEESSASAKEPILFTGTIVPTTLKVDTSYFDDALFIGDSISKGLKLYGVLPEKNVIADQNVGIDQIVNDKDVYYISATKKATLWEAIDAQMPNPTKVYVLLGANGVPGFDNESHIKYYYQLIDKIKNRFPDAIIYIESLTPITKETSNKRKPSFTKEKIDQFNEMVLKMAEEKGVYFLNIKDALMDENGYLLAQYDAGDGTHMPREGHAAVYNYLKEHAVQPGGYIVPAE